MSIERGMIKKRKKKRYVVKELTNAIWGNMDGSRDYNFKWSKSEKDKYDITHMCNLKKIIEKNLYIKQKHTHIFWKQI